MPFDVCTICRTRDLVGYIFVFTPVLPINGVISTLKKMQFSANTLSTCILSGPHESLWAQILMICVPPFSVRCRDSVLSHKSHDALDEYPTMHHFVKEMCTHGHISSTKCCIVWYGTGTWWASSNPYAMTSMYLHKSAWIHSLYLDTCRNNVWGPAGVHALIGTAGTGIAAKNDEMISVSNTAVYYVAWAQYTIIESHIAPEIISTIV